MGAYVAPNNILIVMPGQDENAVPNNPQDPASPALVSLTDVGNKPMGWLRQFEDYIKDGVKRRYYDALITIAGTDSTIGQTVDLYSAGLGKQGTTYNSQANFIKNSTQTNLFGQGGSFIAGVSVIVLAFEFEWQAPPCKPAATGTGNNVGLVTDTADHATQPTGYNAAQYAKAFLTQNTYQFFRSQRQYEEDGRLQGIPASVGQSAAIGGQTTMSVIQNSMGAFNKRLERPKILHSKEEFFVRITAQSALKHPIDNMGWFNMEVIEIPSGF